MPAREAEYLFLTAFNACKTGDKQYNPLKYIAARLDNSDDFKLPPGIQALRLQFSPLDNNGRELKLPFGTKLLKELLVIQNKRLWTQGAPIIC